MRFVLMHAVQCNIIIKYARCLTPVFIDHSVIGCSGSSAQAMFIFISEVVTFLFQETSVVAQ